MTPGAQGGISGDGVVSATFLVATPNADAFAESSSEPGIFIASFDSAEGAWEQGLADEAAFWIDDVGCSVEDDVPHDDGTYLGAEVVLLHPEGRVDIRDTVEATIFVDLLDTGATTSEAPPTPAPPKPPTASASALCPNGYEVVALGTYSVKPCQQGETVEVVQALLQDLGYNIAVDGFWGEGTAAALRAEFGENVTELSPADIEALRTCESDC